MADFKTTNLSLMATTTGYTQLIEAPPSGEFVIEDGGIVIENTTTTDHTFTMEVRKGSVSVRLFQNTIQGKETFIWNRIIRIPSDFTGIFAKTTAAPATAPEFYYTGILNSG